MLLNGIEDIGDGGASSDANFDAATDARYDAEPFETASSHFPCRLKNKIRTNLNVVRYLPRRCSLQPDGQLE